MSHSPMQSNSSIRRRKPAKRSAKAIQPPCKAAKPKPKARPKPQAQLARPKKKVYHFIERVRTPQDSIREYRAAGLPIPPALAALALRAPKPLPPSMYDSRDPRDRRKVKAHAAICAQIAADALRAAAHQAQPAAMPARALPAAPPPAATPTPRATLAPGASTEAVTAAASSAAGADTNTDLDAEPDPASASAPDPRFSARYPLPFPEPETEVRGARYDSAETFEVNERFLEPDPARPITRGNFFEECLTRAPEMPADYLRGSWMRVFLGGSNRTARPYFERFARLKNLFGQVYEHCEGSLDYWRGYAGRTETSALGAEPSLAEQREAFVRDLKAGAPSRFWEPSYQMAAMLEIPEMHLNRYCREAAGLSARESWDVARVASQEFEAAVRGEIEARLLGRSLLEILPPTARKAYLRARAALAEAVGPASPPLVFSPAFKLALLRSAFRATRRAAGWTRLAHARRYGFLNNQRLERAMVAVFGRSYADFETRLLKALIARAGFDATTCTFLQENAAPTSAPKARTNVTSTPLWTMPPQPSPPNPMQRALRENFRRGSSIEERRAASPPRDSHEDSA